MSLQTLFATILLLVGIDDAVPTPGPLVIMGGGPGAGPICARAVELAGGVASRVLVVPQASSLEDAGKGLQERFRGLGVKEPIILDLSDPDRAREQIAEADLIWFGGGDQARLMRALGEAGVVDALRMRHQTGAVLGGTSAGAAVMSRIMIAGYAGREGSPEGRQPEISEGLGLWPETIVDQHFLRRDRIDRLVAAVRRHPDKVGVGIDESTAVVVQGRRFEVIGVSDAIVIDGRPERLDANPADARGLPAGNRDGLAVHRIRSGEVYDLDRGRIETDD